MGEQHKFYTVLDDDSNQATTQIVKLFLVSRCLALNMEASGRVG
jgi:hypothetical protein